MQLEQLRRKLLETHNVHEAAGKILNARVNEFVAACQVGGRKDIQDAHDGCMAAYEAYLDSVENKIYWQQKAQGFDPDERVE